MTVVDLSPTRPALRWHGGKWRLAPWIVSHFPPHHTYVEPYGGAASVLLSKPRAKVEIYGDLDDQVVTLFRVLQDSDKAADLARRLQLTPFARREFEDAYISSDDPVEQARRLVIRSFQGFGSDGHNADIRTGFRSSTRGRGGVPAVEWSNYPQSLTAVAARMQGVVIECEPALEVMRRYDQHDALHYVDPPYLPRTRSQKSRRGQLRYHCYRHEMTDEDHVALLELLVELRGMIVLSGYRSDLYDEALAGWRRLERETFADGARPRIECLWLNPAAEVRNAQRCLFRNAGIA